MDKKINLINKIFSGEFFSAENYKSTCSITDSQDFKSHKREIFAYSGFLGEFLYSDTPDNVLINDFFRFINSIHLNTVEVYTRKNNELQNNLSGLAVKTNAANFFIPFNLLRKIVFIISRFDISKDNNLDKTLNELEYNFKANLRKFPYNVLNFILSFDDANIQKILNSLLSHKYIHDFMLTPLITKDKTGRILKNLPKRVKLRLENYLQSNKIDARSSVLTMFQLKFNMGELASEFKHKGLDDFAVIRSNLVSDEIYDFIIINGLSAFTKPLEKNKLLLNLFSETSNSNLAVLFQSEFSGFFRENCSKRRKAMIEEDSVFSENLSRSGIKNALYTFFIHGLKMQYEREKKEEKLFNKFIRGLRGKNDFNRIFSKMSPLDFAICFKPSNKKVQKYIISKIDSPGKLYLNDFFENKISTVAPLNHGWINQARDNFTENAYILAKLNLVDYVDPDTK